MNRSNAVSNAVKQMRGTLKPTKPKPDANFGQLPRAPKYLSKTATAEFKRVAKLLGDVLQATDLSILAAYCTAFSRWRQAEAILDAEAYCYHNDPQ